MEFLYVSENLTALPTEEFGCRASGELSQPVLCLVERRRMQMGCRQGVEDGMSKGTTCSSTSCEIPLDAPSLASVSLSPPSVLSKFYISVHLPHFLTLHFNASLFSLDESPHRLPALPHVSKFSPVLFLPSCRT